MNLFQKLSAITAELAVVAKNLTVDTGGGKSYKAVSDRDVIDAVKPLEAKYGVYSYPYSREIVESKELEQTTKYGTKTVFFIRLKTVYRFVNVEKPDEYIETTTYSLGLDSGDKGEGKACTYSDKISLLKMYKLSTGDDPDQEASVDATYTNKGTVDEAQKKVFFETCKMLDVNAKEILAKAGWDGQSAVSRPIMDKAMSVLKEISDRQ